MAKSLWRGNKIIYLNDEWVYSDTKEPVEYNPCRPCGNCGKEQTKEGHDGCIGTLPYPVINACCGHGKIKDCYIQFESGLRISGKKAKTYISEMSTMSNKQ